MKWLRPDMKRKLEQVDWKLFVFMLLVLNVKLIVKIIAIIALTILERKSFSIKQFLKQPYLFFYFGMIGIGLVNLLMQYRDVHLPYLLVSGLGMLLWLFPAMAAYHMFNMVQKGNLVKIHRTVSFFFLLHILFIVINLLLIIWETGSINPYTYMGLNQKYYMSTGDFIRGVTFDSPVTTAMIAAFGVLYFLIRKQFLYSAICMIGVLIIVSNLTNIFLVTVFVFLFLFRSDRAQKSMLCMYCCMLLIFITKISPQNSDHIGRLTYKALGKNYFLPPVKVITNTELKQMPDSLLDYEQKRKKTGLLYLDSVTSFTHSVKNESILKQDSTGLQKMATKKLFYEYKPTLQVEEKENRFASFLKENYTIAERDSLTKLYDWERPGKSIAIRESFDFIRSHKSKLLLGTGIGNFSSRVAFKATALNIAGSYPERFRYIHPFFHDAHLYLYLYYHSQWQINHTAANTPDSVYNQLLCEYGIIGVLFFVVFFIGYFFRRLRYLSYGLPMLLLLLAAFSVEYWFEQLSIVILFELLLFLDIRSVSGEKEAK